MLCESLLGALGGSSNNITSLFLNILSYQSTSLKILIQLISSIFCIMAFGGATIIVADVFRPRESVLAPFENAGLKCPLTLIL